MVASLSTKSKLVLFWPGGGKLRAPNAKSAQGWIDAMQPFKGGASKKGREKEGNKDSKKKGKDKEEGEGGSKKGKGAK
jgi:hypothetical protein